jgi:hypothetical protein
MCNTAGANEASIVGEGHAVKRDLVRTVNPSCPPTTLLFGHGSGHTSGP